MAGPLLRGDRLQAAREAMGLTREKLATRLELSSPARIRVWELGLERPRPRFIPRLAGRGHRTVVRRSAATTAAAGGRRARVLTGDAPELHTGGRHAGDPDADSGG